MFKIELFLHLTLWEQKLYLCWTEFFLNRTVFGLETVCKQKLYLYLSELFEIELFWHFNCVLMLNWIVWNRTVYMCKTGWYAIKPNSTKDTSWEWFYSSVEVQSPFSTSKANRAAVYFFFHYQSILRLKKTLMFRWYLLKKLSSI